MPSYAEREGALLQSGFEVKKGPAQRPPQPWEDRRRASL